MSRFQLTWAILMFLGIPAWTRCSRSRPSSRSSRRTPRGRLSGGHGDAVYLVLHPDVPCAQARGLRRRGADAWRAARYGGGARFPLGAPASWCFPSCGRRRRCAPRCSWSACCSAAPVTWSGQARDAHARPGGDGAGRALAADAIRHSALFVASSARRRPAHWPGAPAAGSSASVFSPSPFAVLTASRRALARCSPHIGLCAVPEEFEMPSESCKAPGAGICASRWAAPDLHPTSAERTAGSVGCSGFAAVPRLKLICDDDAPQLPRLSALRSVS